MASSKPFFIFITIFFTSTLHCNSASETTNPSFPPPPPPLQSLVNAGETLSNSGYIAMSLTLELVSDTILSRATTTASRAATTTTTNTTSISALTIFSPPDSAFTSSGQPSLSHLLLHLSPLSISLSSLQSLPFSSKIPSLSPSSSLFLTSSRSDSQVSINNVKVIGSPIYDDGYVVVFAIEDFFDPNFTRPFTNRNPNFNPTPQCIAFDSFSQFYGVSVLLKSKGYSIMASFLELQLIGFVKFSPLKLTVFAPVDNAIVGFSGDFPSYQELFLRHLLPCVLYWTDLNDIDDGTEFKNYVNGFNVKITRVNDVAFVNGVEITYPDLYYNDWLVVHGLSSVIPLPDETDYEMDERSVQPEKIVDFSLAPDSTEFEL